MSVVCVEELAPSAEIIAPRRRYKVSVTARADVPFFGPTLPSPAIFTHGPEFKEFLLTKLINAENACYKAEKFAKLELRTRTSLLQTLTDDLRDKTNEFLGGSASIVPGTPKSDSGPGSRFIDTVKKVWVSRVKPSPSVENNLNVNGHDRLTKKPSQPTISETTPTSGRSASKLSIASNGKKAGSNSSSTASSPDLTQRGAPRPALSEVSDDSSLTSEDLEHLAGGYVDSDTGLESMSSAETTAKACSVCQDRPASAQEQTAEALVQEVTRLKCDKLDLLRQNVRDIKRLREKELILQGELANLTKEVNRLRDVLKDYSPNGDRSPI
ncbi:unnamed protein product [Brassicogethes aeneus]|uniref:Rap-GAP domain-containing protein n=1 Tax=Brassicogethes aeneus TaxID=1431903 RepID=A0A9P0FPP2_BRAAE|nr:unnamed protein product [Brassicogethes aeneus]